MTLDREDPAPTPSERARPGTAELVREPPHLAVVHVRGGRDLSIHPELKAMLEEAATGSPRLLVVPSQQRVMRIVAMTRLAEILPAYATRPEALTTATGGTGA